MFVLAASNGITDDGQGLLVTGLITWLFSSLDRPPWAGGSFRLAPVPRRAARCTRIVRQINPRGLGKLPESSFSPSSTSLLETSPLLEFRAWPGGLDPPRSLSVKTIIIGQKPGIAVKQAGIAIHDFCFDDVWRTRSTHWGRIN